jgi:hypothetical protein
MLAEDPVSEGRFGQSVVTEFRSNFMAPSCAIGSMTPR